MTNKEALHIVANPHLKWKCVEVDSALTIIKNALDKQTPMKMELIPKKFPCDYECPNGCKQYDEYKINYCPECGQKIDWTE